ncbi:PIN domain-containing protein [Cellulomonas sp.]|uniref:type II toxin-antitoxin system VapC family toxin n=1 Tax=Cellulomonas sp. TaxID=40001 RepID=UPI002D66E715|nr:PIN domain-containing protein [Cellulomonas sp.]HYQ73833.1 PIN domain-containing protein [Cellulomonas sp.]
MIVLDAGVLIGFLEPADAHHERAVALLADARAPLLVHPVTLAEVLVGPARAHREVELSGDLRDLGVRTATIGEDEPVLLARLRADTRLKMPDVCVLATAVALDAPLATYDIRLAAAARAHGVLHESYR